MNALGVPAMSELRRLHSPVQQVMRHWLPGILFGLSALWMAIMGVAKGQYLQSLAPPLFFAALVCLFRTSYLRPRPLYASDTHLVIGNGPNARRVPLSSIVSLKPPWWARRMMPPQVIGLRDGSRVMFFPAYGAESFIQAQLRSP